MTTPYESCRVLTSRDRSIEPRERVSDAVRKTVNKFREDPYVFFTETDLHAYLYCCLYSKKLEAKTKDGALTACVHKEHPANFRCSKKTMKDYRFEKKGARGHSIDRETPAEFPQTIR